MKTELVGKLEHNRDELLRALDGLTEMELTTPRVVGEWSIKDVVAHIAYWEQVIHDHVRESLTEGRPHPMQSSLREDAINQRESAKRAKWQWGRARAEFENARLALVERVEKLSESELGFQVPSPWWDDTRIYPVGYMIEEDAVGHCREHTRQIIAWKRGRSNHA